MNTNKEIERPGGGEILAWRKLHGLRQVDAARMSHASERSWQGWEKGDHEMPLATWELLLIKTGEREAI